MPLQILNITPPPILKDQKLQEELNLEGIIHFPFLSDNALAELKEMYETQHPKFPKGPIENFYVSTHSSDIDYKTKISSTISRLITPFCENHFINYRLLTSALLLKKPSIESELGLHQDWSVVDETQFSSYGLWVPLTDINVCNGAIFALKRSHRIGPTYRHTALPTVYSEISEVAEKYFQPFEIKAGHAILFNQALIHKSSSNKSNQVRASIVSTIIPKTATHIMYVKSQGKNELNAWQIDDNYVQTLNSFFEDSLKLPPNAAKTTISLVADFSPIKPEEFEQLYKSLFIE